MHQPQHQSEMTPTPQDHIPPTLVVLDLLHGLGIARCIHVAVHLGLMDRLRDGPKSVEELAQATNTHAPSLYRLLRCLASVGLFAETGPGFFASGVLAEALRPDRPDSIYHLAKWIAQGPDWKLWEHLEYSIRTGKLAMEDAYGMDLWRYLTTHPVESELYDTAMSGFSVLANTPVAQAYDFSSFGTLVDIGGGQGHLLMTILSAYPTVKGVLFDRPTVIERAHQQIEPVLQGRMHLVAGDFFTSVPAGADAYLLKHVLHDWNDEDALRILQTCRRAMKPGSTILIVETIVQPGGGKETLFAKYADLLMLIYAGGRERTAEEFAHLLDAAGFRVTGMVSTGSPMSIVAGVPV